MQIGQEHQSRGEYLTIAYRLLVVMALYTVLRILFWIFNQDLIPDSAPWEASQLYFGGLRFDLSAVLLTNSLFILLSIAPTPLRYRPWWKQLTFISYVVPNTLAVALNGFDIEFYKFTLRRSTASVFETFENEQNRFTLFFRFMIDYWYIYLFCLILIAVLFIAYKMTEKKFSAKPTWKFYLSNTVVLLLVTSLSVAGIRGGMDRTTRPITLSNAGQYTSDPDQIPIVLNTPFSIIRTWDKKTVSRLHYFDDDKQMTSLYNPVKTPNPAAPFKYDNVVIFILESWGKEAVGSLNKDLDDGNYQGYTPFFDSIVADGLSFKYSFANGKKSIDAMPSVLASIPSLLEPYFLSHQSGNRINSIASLLKKKGYRSAFFHGAPDGSMGFEAFANIAGFDDYYGKTEYNNDADMDGFWGIWDEKFFQFFAKTMNGFQQPFLSVIFSVSSHHPFVVPKEYEGKLRQGKYPIYRSINYTDTAMKKFFETARTMPWYKNTLFVFSADHTFSTTAHAKYLNKTGRFEIPIVFYKPDGSLKKYNTTKLVQQIDIMPSILGYLNYDEPYFAFGSDLFHSADEDSFAIDYHNNAIQWYQGNYVLRATEAGTEGLFDFTKDRNHKNDIRAEHPESLKKLETRFKSFLQQYSNRMLDNRLTVAD